MSNELTNIEVIVFEDDHGNQVEMQIVDEFDYFNEQYIALIELPEAEEALDEDPPIQFYRVIEEDGEEMFDYIEDTALYNKLSDALEERLLQK